MRIPRAVMMLVSLAAAAVASAATPPVRAVAPVPIPLAGKVLGVALGEVGGPDGLGADFVGVPNVRFVLSKAGAPVGSAVSSADGSYAFTGLGEGTYQLSAAHPDGSSAAIGLDVAAGSSVRMNFVRDTTADTFRPTYAAALVVAGDPDPDTDGDDVVGLSDLELVRNNQGAVPPPDATFEIGDVDHDGDVDRDDLALVEANFGRAILRSPGEFAAETLPGGSVAVVGDGAVTIHSLSGHTSGFLTAGKAPGTARFTIHEDRGLLAAEELGEEFSFVENVDDPSWIEFELETGRILEGRTTLWLEGGPFSDPYAVESTVGGGLVSLAPGGFSAYRLLEVTGTVEGFPVVGKAAFAADEGNDPKPDQACTTVVEPAGSAICNKGGTRCADGSTNCAKNGKCGSCYSVTAGFQRRDGSWAVYCRGCKCSAG